MATRLKRAAFGLLVLGLATSVAAQVGGSQEVDQYPSKPIRMVAGWPAGGGSDLVARAVCARLAERLGQQVVIDNRPGAGHTIATELVAKAEPNGYTLQFVNANHTLSPFVYGKHRLDTVRNLAPITQVSRSALVLVVSSGFHANSLQELLALGKAKPGALRTGTAGTSGSGAVTTALFKQVSGLDFLIVPYKGGAAAMVALLSGEIHFAVASQATALGYVRNGKVKVIATASDKRLPHMPDVPTFSEVGLDGLNLGPWEGIIAPARTPRAIIERIHRETVAALKHPDVARVFSGQGIEPVGNTPEEFDAEIKRQLAVFGRVFKDGKVAGQN